MQDIAELERRISAALARIDRGIEGLAAPAAAPWLARAAHPLGRAAALARLGRPAPWRPWLGRAAADALRTAPA